MVSTDTPRLARLLVAATVVAFAVMMVRLTFGIPPVLPAAVWDNAYNAVEFLGFAACALRALHTTGLERAAWAALSVGLLGFLAGDLYWTIALSSVDAPPYPSWSDAGYVSIYPAAYASLVLMLRARARHASPSLWLDGLSCAFGVAALGAALVLGVVASTDGSFAAVATNLAYPLGDLALLAFVVAVIAVGGMRAGRTWLLVAAGFAVFAIVDTIYLYQAAEGTYRENTILDAGWPAMYLFVAFAAWQPRRRLDSHRLRGGMLALPAGAALVSVGLLMLDHYARVNTVALWFASLALILVVARLALTFRENLRMLHATEEEATTDALTGLGNRRALVEDLQRAAEELDHGGAYALALFDLDGFKSYNDAFGHPAGDALLERLGRNLAAMLGSDGRGYRMGGDEFCVLAPVRAGDGDGDGDGEKLLRRAAAALSEQGPSFDVGCSYGSVTLDAEHRDPVAALRLADQRMYEYKRGGRPTTAESVHRVLLRVVSEHDGELHHHVVGVSDLAEAVAGRLGLDDADVAQIRRAATLHDIGKLAIPDDILHAPRPLTPEEWEYMHQHTVIGARIIGAAPELAPVATIVRSSHERYDGGGYPDGLAAGEIPLGARIVAVCDSFEAMTAARAYRTAMPEDAALAELERCSGTQFDPDVVAAFLAVLRERRQHAAPAPALTA
jgi:diguanylate cyclase (GGDEF)-like protein/putative nucleotidyltransferase with HDIG domain